MKYRIKADLIVSAVDKETAIGLFLSAASNAQRLGASERDDHKDHSVITADKVADDEVHSLDVVGIITGRDKERRPLYRDKPEPIPLTLDPDQADEHGITPADRERLKRI